VTLFREELFTYDEFFARLRVQPIMKCEILIMVANSQGSVPPHRRCAGISGELTA
jgi:hypothetical protein